MSIRFRLFFLHTAFIIILLCGSFRTAQAHSGKARFHVIIDTDGAADDLRTLCLLLGNREIEVLAITTSPWVLPPLQSAMRVSALLREFHHEGIPVGAGRSLANGTELKWRPYSEIRWGDSIKEGKGFLTAQTLITETLENEEEKVIFIALGALTNLYDVLQRKPSVRERIERVLWYNSRSDVQAGQNYQADSTAARYLIESGIQMDIVSANPDFPVTITPSLLDSIDAVPTSYSHKIAITHRTSPLSQLVQVRHLEAWDDLVAVYLFAPELFSCKEMRINVKECRLTDKTAAEKAETEILSILRGKPDSESRVFYGFPVGRELYAKDVTAMMDTAMRRHGAAEWRAGVLTNELHGHLGIYATIGVKMGIRAREYFNIGIDDIFVTTYAGYSPPVSCMNDGLQVSTGGTMGHGLIAVKEDETAPRPEACFSFKGKKLRMALKPEYAQRIREDVRRGVALHGDLTEAYWQYIRELALQYWAEFDRHGIFDIYITEE